MNSGPNAIRTVVKCLTKCLGISKKKIVARIYVHRIYADKGFEKFWLKATRLPQSQFRRPIFKPTPHAIRKNPSYMGCCRLAAYSSEVFWKLKGWQGRIVEPP